MAKNVRGHGGKSHGKDPTVYMPGQPKKRPEVAVGKGDTSVYPASHEPKHGNGGHHKNY